MALLQKGKSYLHVRLHSSMVTMDNIANRAFLELSEAAKTAASDALKHRYGYRGVPGS